MEKIGIVTIQGEGTMGYKKYKTKVSDMMEEASKMRYRKGAKVKTRIVHGNNEGYMTVGTEVTIVTVLKGHGYDIEDEEGHRINNIGWLV
jgi:hypothetical protein